MKIFTWNIRHGGGARLNEILSEIRKNADSDVIVLTEFRDNKNAQAIRAVLSECGMPFQFMPNTEPRVNTILIATRHEAEFYQFPNLNEHAHRVVMLKSGSLQIFGTYFPQKKEKAKVFSFLADQLKNASLDQTVVVAGDLNTGLHFKDEQGKSFHCSEDFQKLLETGMTDAWRLLNADLSEYSWYSNYGNGFRIDHCLVSSNSKNVIRNCFYIHKAREKKYSDHSQMVLELDYSL